MSRSAEIESELREFDALVQNLERNVPGTVLGIAVAFSLNQFLNIILC